MGQKANADQVYFNYPIPKSVHKQVKQLSLDTNMKVKDIVVNALVMYISVFIKKMKKWGMIYENYKSR